MSENPVFDVRAGIENASGDRLERNRLWWERMPMTYAAWDASDRVPETDSEFGAIEDFLLARSPFLTQFFTGGDFAGRKVLDLGCGVGVLSCLLAQKGAEVTAVDLTSQAVRLTAKNAVSQGLDVRIARANAEAMCFLDESFDFVLSWGVVHHSPNTEQALREIARVLKPGGRGMIMVYHRSSFVYYLRGLYWLIVRGKLLRGYTLEAVQDFCVDGYFHRHFSKRELAGCLRDARLRPMRLAATQQDASLIPGVSGRLDAILKKRFGWYLVAEFVKPGPRDGQDPGNNPLASAEGPV